MRRLTCGLLAALLVLNLMMTETFAADVSSDQIDLISRITFAEAEAESELGKRLVIDTILNRVDSSNFPDDVESVIYQKGQFSPVRNGRLKRSPVKDDIRELVLEEISVRTNSDVVFFNGGNYLKYGVPEIHEGGHYFSKEAE